MEVLEAVEGVFLGEAMNEVASIVVAFLPEGVIVAVTGVEQEVMHHTKNYSSQAKPNHACTGTGRGQIVKRVFCGFSWSENSAAKEKLYNHRRFSLDGKGLNVLTDDVSRIE